MKISKYIDFKLSNLSLFESILISNNDFREIIYSLRDDFIGCKLWDIMDKGKDIKTNYNKIDLSDKNDEISFIPDTQYQNFLKKGEDVSTKTLSKSKIGRMVRQIMKDNDFKFDEKNIEVFVNKFKASWNIMNGISSRETKIVKGDDILYWYNDKNYVDRLVGTLGNSCMKSDAKNHYMKIYAENTNVSLVILTDNDKLLARALLWKLEEGSTVPYFLDRIYTRYDSDVDYIYNWVTNNLKSSFSSHLKRDGLSFNSPLKNYKCILEKTELNKYPYADSFIHLYQELKDGIAVGPGFVKTHREETIDYNNYMYCTIQNTDGIKSEYSHRFSKKMGKYYREDEVVWINRLDSYIPISMSKICNYDQQSYLEEDVVYSESMKDWIPKNRVENDPEFGIVYTNSIISYIDSYKEPDGGIDPIELYTMIQDESIMKYLEVKRVIRDHVNDSNNTGNIVRIDTGLPISYWNRVYKVGSYPSYIKLLCYEMYYTKSSIPEFLQNFVYDYNGNHGYITKLDADVFNIDYNKNESIDVYFDVYMNSIQNLDLEILKNHVDSKKIKKNNRVGEDIKNRKLKQIELFDKYLCANYNSYNIRKKVASILGINIPQFIKMLATNCIESENFKSVEHNRLERTKSLAATGLRRMHSQTLSFINNPENKKIIKDIFIINTYMYIICRDSWDSNEYTKSLVRSLNLNLYQSLESIDFFEYSNNVAKDINSSDIEHSCLIDMSDKLGVSLITKGNLRDLISSYDLYSSLVQKSKILFEPLNI